MRSGEVCFWGLALVVVLAFVVVCVWDGENAR